MREKTWLYQSLHVDVILKINIFQNAKNENSSELSKSRERIRLHANSFFLKNEYFKVEAAKINQTVINKRTI